MRRVQQALDGDEGSGILWGDARHESMLADMIALMRTVQSSKNMEHGLYARMDGYIHGFCLENREFWEPLTAFWLAWLGHTAYEPRYTEMKSSDATIQLMDEASREGVWVTSSSWRVVMNSLQ